MVASSVPAVGQEFADTRDDFRAVQLDIGHERFLLEATHAVFQIEAVRSQRREGMGDLLRDRLGRPDVERPARPDLVQEGFLGGDREPADPALAGDDLLVARPELLAGLLVGGGDVTG